MSINYIKCYCGISDALPENFAFPENRARLNTKHLTNVERIREIDTNTLDASTRLIYTSDACFRREVIYQ